MSLVTVGQIAQENEFQLRVSAALAVAAAAVYAESAGTTGHATRAAYANRVLNGNYNIQAICFAVLSNSTIAAEATYPQPPALNSIPDSDIQFAINSLWNALSGA